MDDLIKRVKDLPPELFSRIYEYTTAVEPNLVVEITSSYRPPAILQLDRSSREEVSKQYYSRGTVFRFANTDQDMILIWLRSVRTRFRVLIERIEVGPECDFFWAHRKVRGLACGARRMGLALTSTVFGATFVSTIERIENRRLPRVKYGWIGA